MKKNSTNDMQLIFEAFCVKRLNRTGWQILGDNTETVGEHTFMTLIISFLVARRMELPLEKILLMALFHDFHEARTGEVDKIALRYVTRDTYKANQEIFASEYPEAYETVAEYEEKKSAEALVVYEANVVALIVELKALMERGNENVKEWIEGNVSRLRLPVMRDLAQGIISGNTQDWWKDIRKELHEQFAK